jgi:hypothetical protein
MYKQASLAQKGIIYVSKEFPRKGFFWNVQVQSTNPKKSCFSSFSRKVQKKCLISVHTCLLQLHK